MLQLNRYTCFSPIYTCPEALWKSFLKHFKQITVPAGRYIFHEGEQEKYLLIISSGICTMSRLFEDGKEFLRYLCSTGSLTGQLLRKNDQILRFSTKAYTDIEGYIAKLDDISSLLDDPCFEEAVLQSEYQKCKILNNRLELLSIQNGRERLMALILGITASCGKELSPGKWMIPFPLSHHMLGNMTIMDRVTVSRYMAVFTRQGAIVKSNNRYCVLLDKIEKEDDFLKTYRR